MLLHLVKSISKYIHTAIFLLQTSTSTFLWTVTKKAAQVTYLYPLIAGLCDTEANALRLKSYVSYDSIIQNSLVSKVKVRKFRDFPLQRQLHSLAKRSKLLLNFLMCNLLKK